MSAIEIESAEATPRVELVVVVFGLGTFSREATRPDFVGLGKDENAMVVDARQPNKSDEEITRIVVVK